MFSCDKYFCSPFKSPNSILKLHRMLIGVYQIWKLLFVNTASSSVYLPNSSSFVRHYPCNCNYFVLCTRSSLYHYPVWFTWKQKFWLSMVVFFGLTPVVLVSSLLFLHFQKSDENWITFRRFHYVIKTKTLHHTRLTIYPSQVFVACHFMPSEVVWFLI